MRYLSRYASPLGGITLSSDGEALTGLWFDGQKHAPAHTGEEKPLPIFDAAHRWLDLYFSGRIPDVPLSLRPEGTPFRQAVWALLSEIPYGHTVTYGMLAEELSRRMGLPRTSARAVGGAVGRNPISLMIPCHRVVGSDGSLVGYDGGLDRKARLLELERDSLSAQESSLR